MKRPVIGINTNFTYLEKYWQFHIRDTYIDAVSHYGGLPLPIPCTDDPEARRQYFEMLDGIIFIGGKDYPPELFGETPVPEADPTHPRRCEADIALMQLALDSTVPILGICAGAQLLNIVRGGRLIQHLPNADDHTNEHYHEASILGGRWLPRIFGTETITVNSSHHQAVNPDYVGKGLRIVARHGEVVEAIEADEDRFALGLQWHPERITDPVHQQKIFTFFLKQCQG
jgi:putative glutamine amidotransferase